MEAKYLDKGILARYLANDCSNEEIQVIKRWMENDPANKRKLKEFEYFWNKAATEDHLNLEDFDIEKDWLEIKRQINSEKTFPSTGSKNGSSFFKFSNQDRLYQLMRVAAIFIVAALAGFWAYQNWGHAGTQQHKPVLQKITTSMGQRVHLTLSDGTRVLLNADSRLKLPDVFSANKREVFLQGQAYFQVAPNPDKPFIIHLNGSAIRVLGTTFSVSAYPEDEQIQVVVKEGRVSFKKINSVDTDSTILTNHELGIYNLKTDNIKARQVKDLSLYLSWIDGYLKFEETLMSEVAMDLERRYNVKVTFRDSEIKNMMLTAFFKSWSIRNVLDVIAASLQIDYKLQNNHVIFFKH